MLRVKKNALYNSMQCIFVFHCLMLIHWHYTSLAKLNCYLTYH